MNFIKILLLIFFILIASNFPLTSQTTSFTLESRNNHCDYNPIDGAIETDESIFADLYIADNGGSFMANTNKLIPKRNLLAGDINQKNMIKSDLNIDTIKSTRIAQTDVIRGPYLQKGTVSSIVIRWRTEEATETILDYGVALSNLNLNVSDFNTKTEHEIEITDLEPNTVYYYRIRNSSEVLVPESADMYFKTHPGKGSSQPFTFWVLGDPGTADNNQIAVRDAFYNYIGNNFLDGILFLGDNAYNDGSDNEYQAAIFDIYHQRLKNSISWSTFGNHDGHLADSESQSGVYFDIFTFPTAGESGGIASGTEAYYSFDYGNVHFIVLESSQIDLSAAGEMYKWAETDIQSTNQEWIIAFFHHPPYTKGSHDSDTESHLEDMRENFIPMLENNGVDLVLGGHSHSYERSYFLNGHYGNSDTFDSAIHTVGVNGSGDGKIDGNGAYEKFTSGIDAGKGAVYVVSGSAGKLSDMTSNHEAMAISLYQLGSCVIEIDQDGLHVKFIAESGVIYDYFTIQKKCFPEGCDESPLPPDTVISYHDSLSFNSFFLSWESVSFADGYYVDVSTDTFKTFTNNMQNVLVNDTVLSVDNLESGKAYQIRIKSYNSYGMSQFSDTIEIKTCYPPISNINLNIKDECNDMKDGVVQIEVTGGGNPVYTSLDNLYFDTLLTYSNLKMGKYELYITDLNKCESLIDTMNISFAVSNITVSRPEIILNGNQNICQGEQTELKTNGIYDLYYWTNFEYEELSDSSKMIIDQAGNYFLEVTLNGCRAISDTLFISTIPTYQDQQICVATVDPKIEKNKIIWSREPDKFINSLNIYKEIDTDVYDHIGAVDYDSANFFYDKGSNPRQQNEKYRISIIDECGNESDLSEFHRTIYLQTSLGLNNTVNLQWNNYEGFNYSHINILRGSRNDSMETLSIIPATINSYTDTNPNFDETLYVIEVSARYTCQDSISGGSSDEIYASTRSNISNINLTTSKQDEISSRINLYPNPSDGMMRVEVPRDFGVYNLFLFNMKGQIVYSMENIMSSTDLDISHIPTGEYMLYLKDSKFSYRFIKK